MSATRAVETVPTSDVQYAAQAIIAHSEAVLLLAAAKRRVCDLGAQRAEKKIGAVERLMAEKGWPISRAESFAQLDGEYHAYKREVDSADIALLTASLNVQSAELAARFHIAQLSQEDVPGAMLLVARTLREQMGAA